MLTACGEAERAALFLKLNRLLIWVFSGAAATLIVGAPWLMRLLAPGPRVISAEAKLSSPGVDRAMDAHFSLPDGGRAHIGCSMFSSSVLRLHAEVTGDNGKISAFNPFSPQYGHRMKVTTSLGTRKERFSRKATYDFQLEAFAAAVEDGASYPTTAVDAIRTMELIDAIYLAAGLPLRQPTPVD